MVKRIEHRPYVPFPGWACVMLAAFLWSTSSFFARAIDAPSLLLTALRALSTGLWMLPFLRPKQIRWNAGFFFFLFSYAGATITYLIAMNTTSAANAVALNHTSPLWLYLLLLWQTRRTTWRQAVPMLLVFVGTVVCMLEPGGDSSFLGNLMGVLSGVSFAAVTLAMARMGQEVTAGHIALANLCAFPIAFALMPSGRLAQFASLSLRQWVLGGCFGLIQLGVPYLIYAVGLKTCPPQRASLLTLIELAFCPLWAYLLVGEIPSAYGLASLLIITLGLASEALLKPSWEVTSSR